MRAAALPLSGWADAQLRALAALSGSADIAALSGETLLGERAALNGFAVPGAVSAGGGCRLYAARDGHVALNLAREDDRELLPALFGEAEVGDLAARFANESALAIVARGRMLGLAIAALDEAPVSPACVTLAGPDSANQNQHPGEGRGPVSTQSPRRPAISAASQLGPGLRRGTADLVKSDQPLIVDLSALWAGPLATSLLRLSGTQVVKVESSTRPDAMRHGDPALFARLNQHKASVALDLRTPAGRDALLALIGRAGIVVAASRPRALRQLGIDADALVREVPGLVWASITGHGIVGDAGDWVGFGDDCAVAGGLSAALRDATGAIGFVGDACADPLTGILAARMAFERYRSGMGGHLVLSMSGVVAEALAAERARDSAGLQRALEQWAEHVGQPFPVITPRAAGPVASLGADNDAWVARC